MFKNRAAAAAFKERELVDLCLMQPSGKQQLSSDQRIRLSNEQEARYQRVTERGLNNKNSTDASPEDDSSALDLPDYFKDAQGVFIWKVGKGITWQKGVSESEIAAIGPDTKWVATGRNRTGRGGEYGWFEIGEEENRITILWAGSFRGKTVYGMTSKLRRDLSGRFTLFILAGGTMAAFLCFSLLAGGASLVRTVRKSRKEALQQTTFVSNVSHELKTPLTSIITRAEMLAEGRYKTDEKRNKALEIIAEEGRRMERMVTDLLDFSRLEHNRRKYNTSTFYLDEVVRHTSELMKNLFSENGLKVTVQSRCEVCADEDAVKEILENLLSNAAKYASSFGEVEVELTKNESGFYLIHVADRGKGLTKEQMKYVFDPFWRADSSTTKETGGYGIGLSIARRLARGMGGDVTVSPRSGGGLTFTLSLPC